MRKVLKLPQVQTLREKPYEREHSGDRQKKQNQTVKYADLVKLKEWKIEVSTLTP